jgi:hypothetical protein
MILEGQRIVSLDPSKRGIALAAFEGRDHLIDWDIAYLVDRSTTEIRKQLDSVLDRNQPSTLILEDKKRDAKTKAAQLVKVIEAVARERNLLILRVTRKAIRKLFDGTKNKHHIAQSLVKIYPELEPRLPEPRKLWKTEDERMDIFDAVSFGFTAFTKSSE